MGNGGLRGVVHKQVDLLAEAVARKQDGFEEVLVCGDGDGVALVVEVAQREAAGEPAVLDLGGAANSVHLSAELGSNSSNKLGHAVRRSHLQTVDAAAGSLELEGEGDVGGVDLLNTAQLTVGGRLDAGVARRVTRRHAVDNALAASDVGRHERSRPMVGVVVRAVARYHGLGLVVQRKPKLVPGRALVVAAAAHRVDLLQSGISELEDVNHADNLASIVHHRQVEVVAIVHLPQRSLDGHVHGRKVGMGGHDADDAAGGRVKTWGNHTKNDILAGEDTRNRPLILHQDGRGVVLLHQLSRLLDRSPDADRGRRNAVQDRLQSRARHLGSQSLNVLDDLLGLAGAELRLDTLERIVQPPGRGIGTLQLLHGVVEALCDIENARDVLVLVHDGQMAEALAHHEIKSVGGAGVGPSAQRVLGHDLGNGDRVGLESGADDAEGQVLGRKDTSNSLIVVGDKDTVFALSSHQLGSFGNGGRGLDLEGGTRLEGEDGSGRGFAGMTGSAGKVLLLGEIALHLAADSLAREWC